jgi:hypothetical protein
MKAEISADGELTIQAETPLESYAMHEWMCDNPVDDNGKISTKQLSIISAQTQDTVTP